MIKIPGTLTESKILYRFEKLRVGMNLANYKKLKRERDELLKEAKKLKKEKDKNRKVKSLPWMSKEADRLFSLYIRNRDGNRCVICGSGIRVQCGHLIRRGKLGTKYNILNCNAQCSSCNYKHNLYPEVYTYWFLEKYGEETYQKLIELGNNRNINKRALLEGVIDNYKYMDDIIYDTKKENI